MGVFKYIIHKKESVIRLASAQLQNLKKEMKNYESKQR